MIGEEAITYARMVVDNIEALEQVPHEIRYKYPAFKEALHVEIGRRENAQQLLQQIQREAYNGQEKRVFGKPQSKREALAAELWYGLNADGLFILDDYLKQKEARFANLATYGLTPRFRA